MKLLCLALMALLGLATSVPQTKENGDYTFGFNAGSHFRNEKKTSDGKTLGEYGFRTPDGCMHVVRYEADQKGGYRVLGSSKRGCAPKASRRRPAVTTTTTKRPTTTTTTTTTTPATTPLTTTTTTTTTPKPVLPPVDNVIKATNPKITQGRQLRQPNLTTRKPSPTTTTEKPEDKPEPTYSFGYTAPSHGHTETGLPDGSKKGEYYWDSPDGWRRIVTYEANERGFFPKMRRVRIPTTTPKPPPGSDLEGDPIAKELAGPDLAEEIAVPVGGCPYYFYYNTRMNYHWERCHENNANRTGEFGHLGSDGYSHKTSYYADGTGFHPKVSRTPLTTRQVEIVAEYTKGTFIIPKPDEQRQQTEKRIQNWLAENREKVENPLG